MNKEILIKLLQLHFHHERKINEFQGKINLDYFEIDLLDVVLDAAGIPADNSVEQMEQYGYSEWLDQPDTFSRYRYYQEFKRQVRLGKYQECEAYLESVFATHQPDASVESILAEVA